MAGGDECVLSSLIPFKVTVADGLLGVSHHHTGVHHDNKDRAGNQRCPVHFLGLALRPSVDINATFSCNSQRFPRYFEKWSEFSGPA